MRRILLLGVVVLVVVAACGGGQMSETEYVESLNDLVVNAGSELEASLAAFEQVADPTLEDFVDLVEEQLIVEYEVRDKFDGFDPPDSIDDVNQVMVDTLARILAAAEGLLNVSDTVSSLEELQETAEYADYVGINADADSMCFDVQARLNDLSARPAVDGPWLADLQRTVKAFLDCEDDETE